MREFVEAFRGLEKGARLRERHVVVSGRVVRKREAGKIVFYEIKSDGGTVQVMALEHEHGGQEGFRAVHDDVRRGDIIRTLARVCEMCRVVAWSSGGNLEPIETCLCFDTARRGRRVPWCH